MKLTISMDHRAEFMLGSHIQSHQTAIVPGTVVKPHERPLSGQEFLVFSKPPSGRQHTPTFGKNHREAAYQFKILYSLYFSISIKIL